MRKLEGSCHCGAVRFSLQSHSPYPYMRCYCSICRKTAGGGGYAINIMGTAESLKVKGKTHIAVYHALMDRDDPDSASVGCRHFCKKCGSCLYVTDPNWPDLVHPFASAIDTPLPAPPETLHIMLDSKPAWVELPESAAECYAEYPQDSIEGWHRARGLWEE